eukprot:gene10218-10288_t
MGDAIIDHLQIKDNDLVLDIAAGTGEPGLTIAAIAKDGKVIATDLSEEMLLIAEANAAAIGLKNYNTQIADVSELPFEDDTFDKISCRMGFMFFPDMQLAANEMYRVLKPGGIVATSVWGLPEQNFWITSIMGIINKYVEQPTPVPGAPGMFRCARPDLMTGILTNAGFQHVGEDLIKGKADYVDADTYWQNMMDVAAPVTAVMDKADEKTKANIKDEMNFKLETEFSKADLLKEVDALKKQIDDLRPLSPDVEGRVMQKLRLDWNYHSNAIEAKGKPLKDHLDIRGHNEAINFLLSIVKETRRISESDIRSLHKMILVEPYDVKAQTSDGLPTTKRITLGEYKTLPNHVQTATGETHYYSTPEETPAKMQELMEWYNETIQNFDEPDFNAK